MTVERLPAPEGWHEIEETPQPIEKYQAENPAFFEHEAEPLGVQVLPDDPLESGIWRVGVVRGEAHDLEAVQTVERGIRGRQSALERARGLMEAFNDQGMKHIETAIEEETNPAAEAPESDE
ncbi:MAG: hypothetical protein ACI8UR_001702 [Natronomonas sp.]|jgi:hypothetical protein|uniref:hypothetical protein n=1 Tax=Natronomonas sp. TaxID=2184060 RepID=UPI003989EABE